MVLVPPCCCPTLRYAGASVLLPPCFCPCARCPSEDACVVVVVACVLVSSLDARCPWSFASSLRLAMVALMAAIVSSNGGESAAPLDVDVDAGVFAADFTADVVDCPSLGLDACLLRRCFITKSASAISACVLLHTKTSEVAAAKQWLDQPHFVTTLTS